MNVNRLVLLGKKLLGQAPTRPFSKAIVWMEIQLTW